MHMIDCLLFRRVMTQYFSCGA